MSPSDIQSELTRILGSALFLSAPESSELLRRLAQQGSVEDPDGAERLRRRLRQYYEAAGGEDPVIIELAEGEATLRISARPEPEPAPEPPKRRSPVTIPVVVLLLAGAAGYGWWHARRPAAPAGPPTVAVLPFAAEDGQPEAALIADGFTQELTGALARCRGMGVIAPASAYRLRESGNSVNATAALRGTLRVTGETLRVNAVLQRTGREERLWGGTYQRGMAELAEIEQAVVGGVVAALQAQTAVPPRSVGNAAAHRLFLQAISFRRAPDVRVLEQATAADANFAAAWAALGDAYLQAGDEKAQATLERALALDDGVAETHTALADLRFYRQRKFDAAEAEYRRAIALAPASVDAHHRYGVALTWRGRFLEAAEELRRARELDPLSAALSNDAAMLSIYAGRLDDAREQTRQTLAWEPRDYMAHVLRGLCNEQEGLFRNAVQEYEQAVELSGRAPDAQAHLGHAFGLSGMRPEALSVARQMQSPYRAAAVYAGLREPQQALAALEQALAQNDPLLVRLPFDPDFNTLHSEAGFGEFVRKAGLR